MKIDPKRVMTLAEAFGEDRLPGSDAARRAADRLAAEFESLGLVVDRQEVPLPREPIPASATIGVGAITAGALLFATAWLTQSPFGTDPGLLAFGFGGLALLALLERKLHTGHWRAPIRKVPCLRADFAARVSGPVRAQVVFFTPLTSRRSQWSDRAQRWLPLAEFIWLAAFIVPCLWVGPWLWLGRAGPVLLMVLGVITLIASRGWKSAATAADNRTGLALLIELARAFAGSLPPGLRPVFVAGGAWSRREFARFIASKPLEGAGCPTAIIALDAPGAGNHLEVGGPLRGLAEPVVRGPGWPRGANVRWAGSQTSADLCISGDTSTTEIAEAVLAAAGELAWEVAARCARG